MSIKTLQADVLIAGAGPAGLTAAIYLARAGKKALVLEGRGTSRMAIPYTIENYPGFSSIGSVELLELFRKQAVAFGAEIISGEAIALAVDGRPKYVTTKKEVIACEALILATGRPIPKARLIGGEGELVGQGVSYCATCDGPLYRGLTVAAVGDTAEALEEVRALHDLGCMVLWVPGGKGSAPDSPEAKALEGRGVTILRDAKVKEIRGGDKVETILLETAAGAETLAVAGVFIFREIPSGPLYGRAGLSLDHAQCLVVDRFQRTSVPGVFAAGDITCGGLQVVAAAGEGCVAALQALVYLRS